MAKEKIIVDGNNVAYEEKTSSGKPKIANLVAMNKQLEERGFEPLMLVDATLRHEIDDPEQLEALFDHQFIHQAPAGTEADYFILQLADEHDAAIVSNDRFDKYQKQHPWIDDRRVPFMIVNGEIQLHGPSLESQREKKP